MTHDFANQAMQVPVTEVPEAQVPLLAIDPKHSAVVEACAGSGKTWMLVSRIILALLQGATPSRILAITFTRKAAREIEDRLLQWLYLMATQDQADVLKFLAERGVSQDQAIAFMPRARSLYEQVLTARPGPTIGTFHSWFSQILGALPFASEAASRTLPDAESRLREEVWQLFMQSQSRQPHAVVAVSLRFVLAELGRDKARNLMYVLLGRQVEALSCIGEDEVDTQAWLAEVESDRLQAQRQFETAFDPAQHPRLAEQMREYVELRRHQATQEAQKIVPILESMLSQLARGEALDKLQMDTACGCFLTKAGSVRSLKASKDLISLIGDGGAERMMFLHQQLAQHALLCEQGARDADSLQLQWHLWQVGLAWLQAYRRFKHQRNVLDYADLELETLKLLRDPQNGPLLQSRLDARYQQILLDEFQDTNPLQWHILLAWLEAYAPASEIGSVSDAPRVFVVGDPKQSIYRFRRADPRIFEQARHFFGQHFSARYLTRDLTRRNAQPIVDAVNVLFANARPFPPFRPQTTSQQKQPGRVEVLPLIEGVAISGASQSDASTHGDETGVNLSWRNLLSEGLHDEEDARKHHEAQQLVQRLRAVIGKWPVWDDRQQGMRAARWDDVMVLGRSHASLSVVSRVLREEGIPCFAVSRGGLLNTQEAEDFAALLTILASPGNNLALAKTLRCPLFNCSHSSLNMLANQPQDDWWSKLHGLAEEQDLQTDGADTELVRASTLLLRWQALAAQLPVHDLLDRIMHEGDVVARYRACVPVSQWPAVFANLQALLKLSLEMGGGRFPSLPRFVDELRRLQQAEDDEAPDEGQIEAHADVLEDVEMPAPDITEGRVRLMTVHAAKGLEAPIVWIVDAAAKVKKQSPPLLMDWPAESAAPKHMSWQLGKGNALSRDDNLVVQEEHAAHQEHWTLLYVAMTRARHYLFVSSVWRKNLTGTWYEAILSAMPALRHDAEENEALVAADLIQPLLKQRSVPADLPCLAQAVGKRRVFSAEQSIGQQYGTAWHTLLQALSEGRAPPPCPPEMSVAQWRAAQQAAHHLIENSDAARFFANVEAMNEVELMTQEGQRLRIDRLVKAHDGWWVLDYKTGNPDPDQLEIYRQQMEQYKSAIQSIFTDALPIQCALIYADGRIMQIE